MVDHSSSWVVTSTPALSSCCESEEKGVTVDVAIPEENILSESIAVSESVAVFEPIAVSQNDAVFVEFHVHDNIAVSKFSQAFEIDMLPVEIETPESNAVVKNPHVHEFDMFVAENYMVTPHAVHEHDKPYVLYDNPQILLQSVNDVEGGMMIADTGCQRQVAGSRWHEIRQRSIQPLTPVKYHDSCSFSFGPHKGTPAEARYAYPAGLGGSMVALGVSSVSCDAPALFSRPAFEILGAVPDIGKGVMFYRALNKTPKLFLASGHLAIRIDEWPDEVFDWPLSFSEQSMPDVFIPDAVPLKINKLDVACEPARRPPHAAVAQHSAMAAQLEVPDGELPRAPVRRADHGAQLCGNVDEAKGQRLHLGQLLPSADGGDHAEDRDRGHGAEEQHGGLSERPQHLRPPKRPEDLRGSRVQGAHLRPLRQQMAREQGQGQVVDPMCTKSLANSEDTAGAQDRRPLLPKEASGHDGFSRGTTGKLVRTMGKFFSWRAALTVALSECPDVQGQGVRASLRNASSGIASERALMHRFRTRLLTIIIIIVVVIIIIFIPHHHHQHLHYASSSVYSSSSSFWPSSSSSASSSSLSSSSTARSSSAASSSFFYFSSAYLFFFFAANTIIVIIIITIVILIIIISKIKTLKVSWLFLHQVQQDINPKGVVALLTLSAIRY